MKLVRVVGILAAIFLVLGAALFIAGLIVLIPLFTTAIRNSRKTHKKYPEQAQDLLEEGQNQIDS